MTPKRLETLCLTIYIQLLWTCAVAAPAPLLKASPLASEGFGAGRNLLSPLPDSYNTTSPPPPSLTLLRSPLHLLFYDPTPPIPKAEAETLCNEALNEAGRNIARKFGDLHMRAEEYYAQGHVELVVEPGEEMTWLMEWEVPGALRDWLQGSGFRGTRFWVLWEGVEVGRGRIVGGQGGLDGG
ncbi:hypothetical protein HO133_004225 [Letharia lupina]|uniref:Uncharacterized protein n=1 Tax=Letharia lupina TaxID=560253 RepID=A0A8H6KZG9_9LECA|nr:uncharacterized protein HO133_004225 [Letharia lupina]KAF6229888.1 hypothetical protein HO133_004225 [Letharia lupina]